MKLQSYDAASGDFVVTLGKEELAMLHSLADGVAEPYGLQDDGALGLTKEQVEKLRNRLEQVIEGCLREMPFDSAGQK